LNLTLFLTLFLSWTTAKVRRNNKN
jgi:hypothetical protein